ncbi:hypothetical protein BP6252_07460 [Coleophoma cylindrospora]|uniref:Uncharacterized protein n=1 Tax=Coleophoma cylindrospora TaxID=1849047 RepID=A0A3D8RHN6_9HELO|nr:hypothetical protein BP6252_07460 [Coleophoma cylindrospora]
MYDEWYLQQLNKINNSDSSQWEVFGLQYRTDESTLAAAERIRSQDVLAWVIDQRPKQSISDTQTRGTGPAGLQLLFTRHRAHESYEIKPWFMSFPKQTFRQISEAMMLPPSYFFLRTNAGGSGDFAKYTTFDEDGNISTLAFVIRVPHSPRLKAKAIWSVAVSWSARTGTTSGLFEGMSDDDIDCVTSYTSAKIKQSTHPLFFPAMLLDILTNLYIQHRKEIERTLFLLENPTGISRGSRKKDAWQWNYDLFRETTTQCNTIYTNLVYLERRLDFTVRLSNFILESLKFCEDQHVYQEQNSISPEMGFNQSGKQIEEAVQNARNFAASQLHQTICLQKRSQALTTVIYTIITQNDSRTNVKISKAVKKDSTSMTAIAFLGIVFLPAMLVASMFSMSMFDFSSPSNPSQSSTSTSTTTSVVNSNFWMYWAVTIPLTLMILLVWKLWMGRARDKDKNGRNEYPRTEGLSSYQKKVNESMESNTPFYPEQEALEGHFWKGEENV